MGNIFIFAVAGGVCHYNEGIAPVFAPAACSGGFGWADCQSPRSHSCSRSLSLKCDSESGGGPKAWG